MKYHQGDIILEGIPCIPQGARFVRKNVIMIGEVTGHAHAVEDAEIYEKDGVLYAKITKEVPMTHEEHPPTPPIKERFVRVRIQKEYFPDGSRQVKD